MLSFLQPNVSRNSKIRVFAAHKVSNVGTRSASGSDLTLLTSAEDLKEDRLVRI